MAEGVGAWVYKFRHGWRVAYRLEVGGILRTKAVFATRDGVDGADAWAEKMRLQITSARARTVEDAIIAFTDDMRKKVALNELRAESVKNADNALRRLHEPVLESALAVLSETRCKELYAELVAGGGAASTQHRFLRTAKTFGAWLAAKKWAKGDAWGAVEQVGKRDDSRDDVLRGTEASKFRDAALSLARGGDDGAVAALLTLVCGLSPLEIVQVEARDIDGDCLWIAGARLKTKNRRRQLNLLDGDAVALLAELASRVKEGPIFGELSRDEVTAAVRRVGAAAGLKMQLDARTMRRTFSTLGARRGASLDVVAYSLGHGADGKAQTARTYYVQPGAAESGHARRVFGVLDGGRKK